MADKKQEIPNKSMLIATGFEEQVRNREQGLCAFCAKAVKETDFEDELSKKEFNISGMCGSCQDQTFRLGSEEDSYA
jgi:hypothetical protein